MSLGESNKMSEKKLSQGLSFKKEFYIPFGEETRIQKWKRWANKQKFPISFLLLALITWLDNMLVEGKIKREMSSIDRQVKYMGEIWDKEDEERQKEQVVYQEKESEVQGLPELRVTNKAFSRRVKGDWLSEDPNSWYYGPLEVFEETEEGTDR